MGAIAYIGPTVWLDAAQAERRTALSPKTRTVNTGHYTFTKKPTGLRVSFPQFRTDGTSAVEIIPVGAGRYAIVRMNEVHGIVKGNELLASLTDFRRAAASHLADWRAWDGR